jgi:hypothetical protein
MDHRLIASIGAAALCLAAACASAQPAPAPAQPPFAVPNPHYVVIEVETTINRPARDVWARVGKFCAIGEWLRANCTIISGNEAELGTVRRVNTNGGPGGAIEIMVAKTEFSYTYAQPARVGVPYNAYHGTMEARPITPTTTRLVYTLFYDNSMMADDAARATDIETRHNRFVVALQNIKTLSEGGILPPLPPPAR